jgi:hypothetical protein
MKYVTKLFDVKKRGTEIRVMHTCRVGSGTHCITPACKGEELDGEPKAQASRSIGGSLGLRQRQRICFPPLVPAVV